MTSHYLLPRIPLDGSIDLTYRCNNNCWHCWLRLPNEINHVQNELSFDEIRLIVDDSRKMGCQSWSISGGEPMLRPDFSEIFDYITRKSISYSLNTNGTLITPQIAQLLKRPGKKMVALYGATADVHDRVTRNPGSFDNMLRGIKYLKEAMADFIIQIVPIGKNFHQLEAMVMLAEKFDAKYRIGATWLWLSACGSKTFNEEIKSQRLNPSDVINLDLPNPAASLISDHFSNTALNGSIDHVYEQDEYLFNNCIKSRNNFHIDPYGGMSFCCFIKDPAMRYNLHQGTFQQAWDEFIPSLSKVVRGSPEYEDNCAHCELRSDCRWCPVFGYLEHGNYSAKVDYLCQIAKETREYRQDWQLTHLRYFQIAGISIQLTTDFPINEDTFDPKFTKFQVAEPGSDLISIRLFSFLPKLSEFRLGKNVYKKTPWSVYEQKDSWIYVGISDDDDLSKKIYSISLMKKKYDQTIIYRPNYIFSNNTLKSLTTFPSDLLLLSHVLALRQGCVLHASGIKMNGQGILFVGHSDAGKTTMMKTLMDYGEILCDERIILRKWLEGFRIHGTWSHGELPVVSPESAPLRAIFYLEKSNENEIIPINTKREKLSRLLSHVIKPVTTKDWIEKTLDLAELIVNEVPAYRLKFDLSGQVISLINELIGI